MQFITLNETRVLRYQKTRLPATIGPPILLKKPFAKDESVFFNTLSSSNFLIFPLLNIWFLQKNLTMKVEKTFSNDIIQYAFYSKSPTFTDFEKRIRFLFEKTQLFFQKRTNFRTYLRNLTISVAFYGKFATIWW